MPCKVEPDFSTAIPSLLKIEHCSTSGLRYHSFPKRRSARLLLDSNAPFKNAIN
jgi:hypothetical protein